MKIIDIFAGRPLTIAILLISLVCCSKTSIAQSSKPNIVIIMADDLDSRQLSAYGGQNINTKHIDALAAEGVQFNQMIASEAMCIPTRASLFTGLYPARSGAYQNHKSVNPGLKSVAHYLGDLDYRVALTGKDHMTKPKDIFPFEIIPGFEPNCVAATDDYYLDSIKTFIESSDDPFCLFVMSINPHAPWTVGDPSEFNADSLVLPPHWVDTRLTRNQFTKYLAEVRRLDDQVGDVVNLLKETGREQNTIVIFLGEQGPQFPGGKWTLYDNGQRSSMIIKWPGIVRPDTETDAIVQFEDITPTLVRIAGGEDIPDLDGKSFLDVVTGKSQMHRDFAYGIHNNIPEGPSYPIRSIRNTDFKLILNLTPEKEYHIKYMTDTTKKKLSFTTWVRKAKTDERATFLTNRIIKKPSIEFYDLKNDPYELDNLANKAEYQAKINDMKLKLEEWMKKQGDTGADMDVPFN